MSAAVDEERDPLDRLAEEFLDRLRRGEPAPISEFLERVPDQEEEARELLSALMMVEGLKPRFDETAHDFSEHKIGASGSQIDRIGDYRIIREIGRGGMGVVYEAEQISLARKVALKILSPSVSRSPLQVQRFLREARSAAQLHHTNIVPVFGVGDQDGLYYYAMQYIGGQGLDKILDGVKRLRGLGTAEPAPKRREDESLFTAPTVFLNTGTTPTRASKPEPARPIDLAANLPNFIFQSESGDLDHRYAKSVARIGVQAAEALEYAHQQRTLHRDIKPSNLLLDNKGIVWVADFGLAKTVSDDDLTETGDLVGTLRYMAPERFRGECDARSDVHALGLTLYELLALRPAFDASNRDRLIYLITRHEPPRLSAANPKVPRDLETIIQKAIEREPSHRYQTAGEMAADLHCFIEDRPIEARRTGPLERFTRWAKRNPGLASLGSAVAVLLAVVVVIVTIAAILLRMENENVVHNLNRALIAEANANGRLIESALSQARASRRSGSAGMRHDGLQAIQQAVNLDAKGNRRLEFRNEAIASMATADLQPVRYPPGWEDDGSLAFDFDPRHQKIARGTPSGEIRIERIADKQLLATLPPTALSPSVVRFSADSRYLAARYTGEGKVELRIFDLASLKNVVTLHEGMNAGAFDFHPDGKTFARGLRDGSIVFHELQTGRETSRLSPGTVPHVIRFDPNGRRLAIASPSSDQTVQIRDATDGKVLGSWRSPEGAASIDWHPNGRWLAAGGEDGRIHLIDATDQAQVPRLLEGHGARVLELVHHPHGDHLASVSEDGTIRLWNLRTGREVVKGVVERAFRLRFSRDGTHVGPGHDGNAPLIWGVLEGQEYRPLLKSETASTFVNTVEPIGGTGLVVASCDAGLRITSSESPEAETLAAMPGTRTASVSPDGSFIVSGGAWGLLHWPVHVTPDRELQVGPPTPIGPRQGMRTSRIRLGRDGRTLAAVMDEERGLVLVIDLNGTRKPVELVGHPNIERLDVSPDGAWIATASGQENGNDVKIWDATTGRLITELPVDGGTEAQFSPDGLYLLSGTGNDYRLWTVGLWSLTRSIPREQAGDSAGVAAFSNDGRILAVARTRGIVQLIETHTGQEIATLEPSAPQQITGLAFDGEGGLLVAARGTDALRRWDLKAVRKGLAALNLDDQRLTMGLDHSTVANALTKITVQSAEWLAWFEKGDELARADRWSEAAASYRKAINAGAPGIDPWSRMAMTFVALGDLERYKEVCEHMTAKFGGMNPAPKMANNIGWSCSLGPGGLEDYEKAIAITEGAAASGRQLNRLNTLGAIYYRAGRTEQAIKQLVISVEAHGAGGTPYDAFFLAMAYHRLGDRPKALEWLHHAQAPSPIAMRKPDVSGPSSWIPRVELEILRREASALIGPDTSAPVP